MSEALTGHNIAINLREDGKIIDVHVRWARQEELTVPLFGEKHLRALGKIVMVPAQLRSSEGHRNPRKLSREPSEGSLALPVFLLSFLHHNLFRFD